MKKVVKTRAFKDRLKGHKDGVITLFSPEGAASGWLYSASKDGCIRSNENIIIIIIMYSLEFG
jgi:hypothetical protein